MIAVVSLLLLGVVAARLRWLPDGTAATLDAVILRLSLPGLILATVPGLPLDTETVVPVAMAWGSLAALAVAVLLLARLLRWDRRVVGTLLLVVPLGNTSFLGIPAVSALLGADHVPYAVLYDQLGSFLALATWGSLVAARYGSGARPDLGSVTRRILTFPPLLALAAAVVIRSTGAPAAVHDVASLLGSTLTPLAMLSVGLRLTLPRAASLPPLLLGLALRMAAAPALGLVVMRAVGGTGAVWETSVLEAAMPPMVTAGVVAAAADLDPELSAALVGGGILVALLSLPFWAGLL